MVREDALFGLTFGEIYEFYWYAADSRFKAGKYQEAIEYAKKCLKVNTLC
jgi:hypothetical protein